MTPLQAVLAGQEVLSLGPLQDRGPHRQRLLEAPVYPPMFLPVPPRRPRPRPQLRGACVTTWTTVLSLATSAKGGQHCSAFGTLASWSLGFWASSQLSQGSLAFSKYL